jgi:hypothetical protein
MGLVLLCFVARIEAGCRSVSNGAMKIGWELNEDAGRVKVTLTAKVPPKPYYMAFGLSGSAMETQMVGGDVVVTSVINGDGRVEDAFLQKKKACTARSGSETSFFGVCQDTVISNELHNNARLVSGEYTDGVMTVVYTRPYKAGDVNVDKAINAAGTDQVIWAMGPYSTFAEHHDEHGGFEIDWMSNEDTCSEKAAPVMGCHSVLNGIMKIKYEMNDETSSMIITLATDFSQFPDESHYMAFGLSGSATGTQMVGGDVVIASVIDGVGTAYDSFLQKKDTCTRGEFFIEPNSPNTSDGKGVCSDVNVSDKFHNNAVLITSSYTDGVMTVVYSRRYTAEDAGVDKTINAAGTDQVIWALGPIHGSIERVAQHHSKHGGFEIDWTSNKDTCSEKEPAVSASPAPVVSAPPGRKNAKTGAITSICGFVTLTYTIDEAVGTVRMQARAATAEQSWWVGIGLSPDGGMIGSRPVIGLLDDDGQCHVEVYDLAGKHSADDVTPVVPSLVSDRECSYDYGVLTFDWTQPLDVGKGLKIETSNVAQHVVFGKGPVGKDGRPHRHKKHGSGLLNFESGVVGIDTSLASRRATHAWFMTLGLGVFFPVGMFMPRFRNVFFPSSATALGVEHSPSTAWFKAHIAFMLIGITLASIGFGIIVNLVSELKETHFSSKELHALWGLLIMLAVLIQLLLGVFRTGKDSPRRVLWAFAHFWLGRLIVVATVPQVLMGIHLDMSVSSRSNSLYWFLYIAWACVLFVGFVFLELRQRKISSDSRSDGFKPM